MSQQKKSIWEILDAVLEPAVQVYTDIRGVKPPDGGGSPDDGGWGSPDNDGERPPVPFKPCDEGYVLKDGKCVKEKKGGTTLLIIGGVLVLGAAGYFIWKKFSNKTN